MATTKKTYYTILVPQSKKTRKYTKRRTTRKTKTKPVIRKRCYRKTRR